MAAYRAALPGEAEEFERFLSGGLPAGWESAVGTAEAGAHSGVASAGSARAQPESLAVAAKPEATRSSSGRVLQALARAIPNLVGGSADLAPSNNTHIKGADSFLPDHPGGRNLHFGVREHAMGGILSGMALHGGLRVYGGTFLIFSDYMRPAIRLAALMGLPVTYVFTHDSIGLGEDGPTHQPIEQLMALRAIPGLMDFRPADAVETAAAWRLALARSDGPAFLALTRQPVPQLEREGGSGEADAERGGYVFREASGGPSGGRPDRLGIGAPPRHRGRDGDGGRRDSHPCREPPPAGTSSPGRSPRTSTESFHRTCSPASRWKRAARSDGPAGSARWGRRSAWTVSAPLRPEERSSENCGSPPAQS